MLSDRPEFRIIETAPGFIGSEIVQYDTGTRKKWDEQQNAPAIIEIRLPPFPTVTERSGKGKKVERVKKGKGSA